MNRFFKQLIMRFVLSYPVLSVVSNGYPRLRGRLPTCYSPVRHGIATIRLACIRHAASVNPEPGSNSPKNLSFVLFFSFLLLFFFRIALLFASSFFISSYTVFKDLNSCHFLSATPIYYYFIFFLSTFIFTFLFTFFKTVNV